MHGVGYGVREKTGATLPKTSGLRPRQVFLRHTCRVGSLPSQVSLREGFTAARVGRCPAAWHTVVGRDDVDGRSSRWSDVRLTHHRSAVDRCRDRQWSRRRSGRCHSAGRRARRARHTGLTVEDPAHLENLLVATRQANAHTTRDRLRAAVPATATLFERLAERGEALRPERHPAARPARRLRAAGAGRRRQPPSRSPPRLPARGARRAHSTGCRSCQDDGRVGSQVPGERHAEEPCLARSVLIGEPILRPLVPGVRIPSGSAQKSDQGVVHDARAPGLWSCSAANSPSPK